MRFFNPIFIMILSAFIASLPSGGFSHAGAPSTQRDVLSNPVTVLELFTSQGCSSCPSANKFVREITETNTGLNDVLTLSYSVDYWDYLGWKDTFGKPEFSSRQRTYGKQFDGKVYTPQMVVNGAVHNSRFSDHKVRTHKLDNIPKILIKADGDDLKVQVLVALVSKKPLSIMAVRYRPGIQSVPVKRGENRGRTMMLVNVVQACTEIGKIKNLSTRHSSGFNKTLSKLADGEALVIFVQDGRGGPILGAANYTP